MSAEILPQRRRGAEPQSKLERDLEIDVGFHVVASRAIPGVPIPDRTIGEVCGRSHGWVCMMNRRLMRKIRARLGNRGDF